MARSQARPHLVMVVTEDWFFWSHRRSIARGAVEAGFRVTLASRFGEHRERIEAMGVECVPIRLERTGRNPLGEALAVLDLARLYRRLRPDVVHHVAIKPVLYGSAAARLAGVRNVVNAVSGLGYALTAQTPKARALGRAVVLVYRTALGRRGTRTILQNADDRQFFVDRGVLDPDQVVLIRGSGVDLDAFRPSPEPPGPPVVLYAGRMLTSKGVGDLVEAGRHMRAAGVAFRLALAGWSDLSNPEAIAPAQLEVWGREGLAELWGRRDDMAAVFASSHVVALASDREGVPKVLLEAAGAGLPLVATDVPGCREVVDDGSNGFLVSRGDPGSLAAALTRLCRDPRAPPADGGGEPGEGRGRVLGGLRRRGDPPDVPGGDGRRGRAESGGLTDS